MKQRTLLIAIALAAAIAGGGYGLYSIGMHRGMDMAADAASAPTASTGPASAAGPQSAAEGEDATRRHMQQGLKAGDIDPLTGKKILYYHDPMVPGNKFDKPAKSPFMDMMMSPVYADSDSDQGKVTVSPRIQQNLGVRTAAVTEGTLSPQVAAVGSIAFNERDQAVVQARATGYVERLHVRATLDRVAKGQPLVELYVPEWIAAQEEFLSVRRMQGTDLAALVDAARARMRQVGMSDEQIRLVESTGRTQPRITLAAPIGGVVTELSAREGMTVMSGATLFRINGLSTVWANAEVMLVEDNGRFRPIEVEAGIESGGQTQIKRGLEAGQRVVVSSQFLIDSEASLKGVEARLNDAPKPTAANAAPRHEGEAKVEAIGRDAITLSHGPIP